MFSFSSLVLSILACAVPVEPGTRVAMGETVPDFVATDSSGGDVSLFSFAGRPIILDVSAMWCGPCQQAASELEEELATFDPEGEIAFVTLLVQNLSGNDPEAADLALWEETFGITSSPVLAGSHEWLRSPEDIPAEGELDTRWPVDAFPTFFFINEKMQLVGKRSGYNADAIFEEAERVFE